MFTILSDMNKPNELEMQWVDGTSVLAEIDKYIVQPELAKRFAPSAPPDRVSIREVLIKLPPGRDPIVQFNSEIKWGASVTLAPNVEAPVGHELQLYEFEKVHAFKPPKYDGKFVSFIYIFWAGGSYNVSIDVRPSVRGFDDSSIEFVLGEEIVNHLKYKLIEALAELCQSGRSQLAEIGLWPILSLMPYPISEMLNRIRQGMLDEARELLVDFVDAEFIKESLLDTWNIIGAFDARRPLFEEALQCHAEGMYLASISTLVGHIEGTISDWLLDVLPSGNDLKRGINSKLEQFQEILEKIPHIEYAHKLALDEALEFLREGQLLQKFVRWNDTIDSSFPARHAIQHGKFVSEIFTQENSVKLFLMLDTICYCMIFYEACVLRRDFGESPTSQSTLT